MRSPEFTIEQRLKRNQRHKHLRSIGREVVYVIQCNDYYKIGITLRPAHRFQSLQVSNPYKIYLVYSKPIIGARAVERKLHQSLRSTHVRGEWFKLDSEQLQLVKDILDEAHSQTIKLR